MADPLVSQGTLNRLRGSVVIPGFPTLNVTAPYLGKEGIRLALEGDSVVYIPTMTGAVTSPEPYMMVSCRMNLLKTQALAASYKSQMESNSLLGDFVIRTDSNTLPVYQIKNGSIQAVPDLNFAGDDAAYNVVLRGYYLVNSGLFG